MHLTSQNSWNLDSQEEEKEIGLKQEMGESPTNEDGSKLPERIGGEIAKQDFMQSLWHLQRMRKFVFV